MILDILSWISIAIGAFFVLVGGIGIWRMPDLFTRMHPAGITDSTGAGFVLLGLVLQSDDWLVSIKLALIFIFILFTSPVATHALAHAALLDGLKPWTRAPDKTRNKTRDKDGAP
jgi:multicomponent Na+:H+ antiporter subunit G